MKRVLWTTALLAAVFCLSAVTAAYLINGSDLGNSFTVGGNTIDIQEDYEPPEGLEPGENEFRKRVCAENTGSIPCFVRIFAEFSDSSIRDISEISADAITWYPAAEYRYHLPSGWEYIEEDELLGPYYYYTEALEPGEKTPALFDSVKTVIGEEEQIIDYEIIVYAESIQTLDLEGNEFGGSRAWQAAWREFLSRR